MTPRERRRALWAFVSEHPGKTFVSYAQAWPFESFYLDLNLLVDLGYLETYAVRRGSIRYRPRIPLVTLPPQEAPGRPLTAVDRLDGG